MRATLPALERAHRVIVAPGADVYYLLFRTRRGPFTDGRLRQAVNFAIDRRQYAARSVGPGQGASGATSCRSR